MQLPDETSHDLSQIMLLSCPRACSGSLLPAMLAQSPLSGYQALGNVLPSSLLLLIVLLFLLPHAHTLAHPCLHAHTYTHTPPLEQDCFLHSPLYSVCSLPPSHFCSCLNALWGLSSLPVFESFTFFTANTIFHGAVPAFSSC